MSWFRFVAVILLGTALFLFRVGHGDVVDIQDAQGDLESPLAEGAVALLPNTGPEVALRPARLLPLPPSPVRVGRIFVSDIFRPPIAPLAVA